MSDTSPTTQKHILMLYDATCRFCEASSKRALQLVPEGRIQRQDINDPVIQRIYAITPAEAQRQIHVIAPTGKIFKGAEAVRYILVLNRWLWPLALLWFLPGFPQVAQWAYNWVAEHRYLFMGRIDREAVQNGESCNNESCQIHLGLKKPDKDVLL